MATSTSAPRRATRSRYKITGKVFTTRKRMVYGFVWTDDDLIKWGVQKYGPVDSGNGSRDDYLTRAFMMLKSDARDIWRRADAQPVASITECHDSDYSIALADNKSKDTIMPPPQEVIDRLKVVLMVMQEPKWRFVRGSY